MCRPRVVQRVSAFYLIVVMGARLNHGVVIECVDKIFGVAYTEWAAKENLNVAVEIALFTVGRRPIAAQNPREKIMKE